MHPSAAAALDKRGLLLLASLQVVSIPPRSGGDIHPDIPIAAKITDADIIGDIELTDSDASGQTVARYFFKDGIHIALKEVSHEELKLTAISALKDKSIAGSVSQEFAEKAIFAWCKSRYTRETEEELSDWFFRAVQKSRLNLTVWVPLSECEVSSSFKFGPVQIGPITKSFLDATYERALQKIADGRENAFAVFDRLRSEVQGRASVVFEVLAEPRFANDRALELAGFASLLLRMLSRSSASPWSYCQLAPAGALSIPKWKSLTFEADELLEVQEGIRDTRFETLRLSDQYPADNHALLHDLGEMVDPDGLSGFEIKLRAALLIYSDGIGRSDLNERLVLSLTALEGIFLRDASEPIAQNLSDRMAFLVGRTAADRIDIAKTVKLAYAVRSKYVHHALKTDEVESLTGFFFYARVALLRALALRKAIKSVADFVSQIEKVKFGG